MKGNAIHWTPELIEALRQLRRKRLPTRACADALGISEHPVERKMRDLGLNQRHNQGRRPGWKTEP